MWASETAAEFNFAFNNFIVHDERMSSLGLHMNDLM